MTTNSEMIERLLANPPVIHRGETEHYAGRPSKRSAEAVCYGCAEDVLLFLSRVVRPGHRTLEIGCGQSTLVFAGCGADHTTVSPNLSEFDALRVHASTVEVSLARVTFVAEPSETYLPGCGISGLDLVLIDGKHAFPWPMIDWFFTADRLVKGGTLVLDDTNMVSVGLLVQFLDEDPRWRRTERFERSAAYVKLVDMVHQVAWHEQPFITNRFHTGSLVRRTAHRVYRALFPKRK